MKSGMEHILFHSVTNSDVKVVKIMAACFGGFLYSIGYNESFCLSDKSFFSLQCMGQAPSYRLVQPSMQYSCRLQANKEDV